MNIFDKCNEATNEKVSEELLKEKIEEFDNCDIMQMSESGYSLNFVSHPSFQEVLEKRWYNQISPNCSTFKVIQTF